VNMADKGKKAKKPKSSLLGGVPLGSALEVLEGVGGLLAKYLSQRYEVEKRVEELKEETSEKVEEIRDEAIKTGYALKKAFLKTMVEALMLVTGMLSLILGLIILVKNIMPLEYVLMGYGFLVLIYVSITLKLSPQED